MGVIHKLTPDVCEYIVQIKKTHPRSRCRQIADLVRKRFNLSLSGSSINIVVRNAGLSLPSGRPRKSLPFPSLLRVQPAVQGETNGLVLLKALDHLIGGSAVFSGIISRHINMPADVIRPHLESLMYRHMLSACEGADKGDFARILQNVQGDIRAMSNAIPRLCAEVRCIKCTLSSGRVFWLDGQFHTVWSGPHIPPVFSTALYDARRRITEAISEKKLLVLFMAPGYDAPPREFLDLICACGENGEGIAECALYGARLQELEVMDFGGAHPFECVCALWPWQFVKTRVMRAAGPPRSFRHEPTLREFYAADAGMRLAHPRMETAREFNAALLQDSPRGKAGSIIISTHAAPLSASGLAALYLDAWPNLEECFQDFSRKVEIFSSDAAPGGLFPPECIGAPPSSRADLREIFDYYLKSLRTFFIRRLLPFSLSEEDAVSLWEDMFGVKTDVSPRENHECVRFLPPAGFRGAEGLSYACRRLNERALSFEKGKKVWFFGKCA